MSTGGGTTTQTTVQNSAPWGPTQPYLTDLMGQAQNLYNSSSQNTGYAPFDTVAPLSDQTQQALNATFQRATNGSPLIGAADQLLTGLLQPQTAPGTAALQGLASGYADPGMAYAQAGAGANPYAGFLGAQYGQQNAALPLAGHMATANPYATPAAAYLGAQASGSQINPYLNQMYQAAASPVIDSVNSVFGQAGRTGSGAQQQELTRNLGDLAANIYGNNYLAEQQLQQSAAGQIQNAYDSAAGRNLSAASLLGNLSSGDLSRNADIGNQLASVGENQMNRYLSAGNQLSAGALNQANVRSGAAGALNSQFNTGNNLMLNAAQYAPTLAGQDYTDLQNALSVGGAYDQQAQNQINDLLTRWTYQQQQPWNLLDNYSGLVTGYGGLGGTVSSNQTKTVPGQSLIPSLVGLGMSALKL